VSEEFPGVIWITGFSGAGKTTVGRKVEARLRAQGLRTLFLDGDDLRSILAHRWGYERGDRVDLARVYFHLCSHIAAQGLTVVISAVAMYDEVRVWLRDHVARTLEVYLNVPLKERRRRDARTKRLYDRVGNLQDLYDPPTSPDLIVDNFGGVTPDDVADRIALFYRTHTRAQADWGRTPHWQAFYSNGSAPVNPSPFALSIADRLMPPLRILEVGCGNGRDAAFFASLGHQVTGIDASAAAIEQCRKAYAALDSAFLHGTLPDLSNRLRKPFDALYCRFVLHAMPLHEEVALLDEASLLLRPGGRVFLEARSINDPMARMGEVISPTERIHGHYRRFIIREELERRLRDRCFQVESSVEADGLALHGNDNPVVVRVAAMRQP